MADNFPLTDAQVLDFADGNEAVAIDAYDALYAYYTTCGGSDMMPYGTAKARTGDPDQFIADQLEKRASWIRRNAG